MFDSLRGRCLWQHDWVSPVLFVPDEAALADDTGGQCPTKRVREALLSLSVFPLHAGVGVCGIYEFLVSPRFADRLRRYVGSDPFEQVRCLSKEVRELAEDVGMFCMYSDVSSEFLPIVPHVSCLQADQACTFALSI